MSGTTATAAGLRTLTDLRAEGSGLRGSGFRVQGSGFRV